jgi:hypothetical protein
MVDDRRFSAAIVSSTSAFWGRTTRRAARFFITALAYADEVMDDTRGNLEIEVLVEQLSDFAADVSLPPERTDSSVCRSSLD